MKDHTQAHSMSACLGAALTLAVLVGVANAQVSQPQEELPPPRPTSTLSPQPGDKKLAGPAVLGLPDLVRMSLELNPHLAQARYEINAAQGIALQAGLYPNPSATFIGEEVGKFGGNHTLPQFSQEIVTGGKLRLSRAVALRDVDLAYLGLIRRRLLLLTIVRQGYFEVLGNYRRIEMLEELVRLATEASNNAKKLLDGKQIAELDYLPFIVELNRLKGEQDAAHRELQASWRRLAANMGAPDLPLPKLVGALDSPLPSYSFDQARALMLESHPEVLSAQVGINRAQLALRREQAQVIPNVTLAGGYTLNLTDRENQGNYNLGFPIPVWNRNQGNIRAAEAELGRAMLEVNRVQNDLTNRLAFAFGQYAAALERAERYRKIILPNADRAYQISRDAFKGGQFEYLRVIQAQRAAAEANLEYIRLLTDAWQAASEIAGLLLEEEWPLVQQPKPKEDALKE